MYRPPTLVGTAFTSRPFSMTTAGMFAWAISFRACCTPLLKALSARAAYGLIGPGPITTVPRGAFRKAVDLPRTFFLAPCPTTFFFAPGRFTAPVRPRFELVFFVAMRFDSWCLECAFGNIPLNRLIAGPIERRPTRRTFTSPTHCENEVRAIRTGLTTDSR